ncbi:IS630 family transposase [Zavarzinella formosa]|uniref:IS630 family transposase n=1 Tax=Zavarzinella formosa TaxID=360055 RepID=UPI0002F04C75|nr:IS630 family transposase [Zavarzinella formosa]
MRSYSNDLRVRIYEARQSGKTTAEVAERFGACAAFVRRRGQRFRETGSLAPRLFGRGPARQLADHKEALRQAVLEHPDATPAEHRKRLRLPASRVTVWRTMRRFRLTRKKKSVRVSEQDRPDVAEAGREWPSKLAEVSPDDLVFLDETEATTAMQRTQGYGPAGERVVAEAPFKRRRDVTFVGALTSGGPTARWTFEGAMNGELFSAYVGQVLVPSLRPGMVVVMDNLPCHKVDGIEAAIQAAGCRLEYLPPSSPDLNPIETPSRS